MNETTKIIMDNFHEDIEEIKKNIIIINQKIDELRTNYVKHDLCKERMNNQNENIDYKKTILICSSISGGLGSILTFLTNLLIK